MSRNTYTPAQRYHKLQEYHAYRRQGLTAYDAAEKVGVPYITLRTWEKKEKKRDVRKAVMGALGNGAEIKAPSEREKLDGPRLVLPNGMKVYGPVDELIKVLKAVEGRA